MRVLSQWNPRRIPRTHSIAPGALFSAGIASTSPVFLVLVAFSFTLGLWLFAHETSPPSPGPSTSVLHRCWCDIWMGRACKSCIPGRANPAKSPTQRTLSSINIYMPMVKANRHYAARAVVQNSVASSPLQLCRRLPSSFYCTLLTLAARMLPGTQPGPAPTTWLATRNQTLASSTLDSPGLTAACAWGPQ